MSKKDSLTKERIDRTMRKQIKISTNQYLEFRYTVEKLIIVLLSPFIGILFLSVFLYVSIILGKKIIFSQLRPGKDCKPFLIFKFRTFNDDGIIPNSLKFLRLHRLDEIPQFFNILKGDMSLIGPRPEPLTYYKQIIRSHPEYNLRYKIKPGLTGLSQVEYGHSTKVEEAFLKFKYDLDYLNNLCLSTDLKIIYKTISIIFTSKGAENPI
ncbi:MAG: sugar transferase [Candidatus Kapabacteria bacterium]|nr:sugar transferase [Candidatus Kapabacteria bacterium]